MTGTPRQKRARHSTKSSPREMPRGNQRHHRRRYPRTVAAIVEDVCVRRYALQRALTEGAAARGERCRRLWVRAFVGGGGVAAHLAIHIPPTTTSNK